MNSTSRNGCGAQPFLVSDPSLSPPRASRRLSRRGTRARGAICSSSLTSHSPRLSESKDYNSGVAEAFVLPCAYPQVGHNLFTLKSKTGITSTTAQLHMNKKNQNLSSLLKARCCQTRRPPLFLEAKYFLPGSLTLLA